jgi:kinetochore protein Spc7/SPC105
MLIRGSDKLQALEGRHSWSLVSLNGPAVTLAHKKILQLTFHPSAFISNSSAPSSSSPNADISLRYVGPEDIDASTPSATAKRFFLQLLRAKVYAIPQCHTRVSELVRFIQQGWDLCARAEEAVRALEVTCVSDVFICGDEKLAIEANLLLNSLRTKVRIRHELSVAASLHTGLEASVQVRAKVVYGEKYDEPKMGEFLMQFVKGRVGSSEEVLDWAKGMEDLRERLVRRGRKGVRV